MPPNGTHVLEQVNSLTQARSKEAQFRTALQQDGITALCLRIPWNVTARYDIWDWGLALAREEGAGFYPRFMAGRYTPSAILHGGNWYHFSGTDIGGNPVEADVPLPCQPDGGDNTVFIDAYRGECSTLAQWATDNDVGLLHYAWFGRLWAELDVGAEVTSKPGNSMTNIIRAHTALWDAANDTFGGLVEFPFSGHGPANQFIAALTAHALAENPDRSVFQMNGTHEMGVMWTPQDDPGDSRPPPAWCNLSLRRAFQMLGVKNTYVWPEVYDRVEAAALAGDSFGTDRYNQCYLEVYTPSFTGGTSTSLYHEAALWNLGQTPEPEPNCEEDLDEALAQLADCIATSAETDAQLAAALVTIDALTAEKLVLQGQVEDLTVERDQAVDKLEAIAAILVAVP